MKLGRLFLVFLDWVIALPYTLEDFLAAWEESEFKPFQLITPFLEELGEIYSIRVYDSYFNPSTMTMVLEYLVETNRGLFSVKIVYGENPGKAIAEYFKRGKRNRL